MKKIIVLTLSALLIASCLPRNVQVPQSPLLSVLERKSGLIGYVGLDGNIYVSDQGGRNPTQLTKDAVIPQNQGEPVFYYQYPTWSRDGSQLAFIGVGSDGEQIESKLMVADVEAASVNEVYTSESEHPVYVNWSPDNASLSFISTNVSGENMILQSVPSQGGERTIFDTGSPYYWSWAPDGHVMVVHAGGAANSAPEHLSFLSVGSTNITEQALDSISASFQPGSTQTFQAPAWSPDGSRIALARAAEEGNEIVVTDAAGEDPKKVGTFTNKTAFAWSPDSTRLAYLDGERPLEAGTVGPLHVVDLETSEEIVQDENIAAFFWSPSGEELAYFILFQEETQGNSSGGSGESTQNIPQLGIQLHVLDVVSGESRALFTYQPTRQFLNVLPYFDQYHQSATIWSPDNNNLVLSFVSDSGTPAIAIVAASGNLQPRTLAEGYLAFWSWK